jgi:hypothetical protein
MLLDSVAYLVSHLSQSLQLERWLLDTLGGGCWAVGAFYRCGALEARYCCFFLR